MKTEIRIMYAFDAPGKNNPGGRNQGINMSADENDMDDEVDTEEYEGEEVDVDEDDKESFEESFCSILFDDDETD